MNRANIRKATIAPRGLTTRAALIVPMIVLLPADPSQLRREGQLVMSAQAKDRSGAPLQSTMPPARDPSVAVEEEYQIARKAAKPEALELFIARHPDSPQAQKARSDLASMKR